MRLLAALLVSVTASADPLASTDVPARMKQFKTPGMSVAVIADGRIVWERGYGVIEAGGSISVNSDTLFQAASISKPVAASAALHMSQYGNFTLDEDVNGKLKSWRVPENEWTRDKKVTLRGLLSHSAGLTVHGFPGYASGVPRPSLVEILDGAKPANTAAIRVDIVPGSKWRYSGGGYEVAELLMTERFGKPFPIVMETIVLRRLGMKRSTFAQPLPEELARNAARAHNAGKMIDGRWHAYPEHAAAGLWTTPGDLARFMMEIAAAWAGKSTRLIEQRTAREMLTRQSGSYGLGVALDGEGSAMRFGHSGGNAGFRCRMALYPASGKGAVVMTNADEGDALMNEILAALAKESGWPEWR
jgi:CubicO group peptidase (beta-lactamase class C family)